MRTTDLPGLPAPLPELALGTMTFGDTVDLDGARTMVDVALDAGVTSIDTANGYAAGRSETTPSRHAQQDAPSGPETTRQDTARHASEEPRRDEGGADPGSRSAQRPPSPPRNGQQAPHYQR